MKIPLEQWQAAFDSQARAMLVATREAVKLMPDGGRIIAITYAPGGRTGTWAPWVAMGSAKAALESLCRYFAVALATRRITVNAVSPGVTDDSVFNTLPPEVLQMLRKWAESGWVPMRQVRAIAEEQVCRLETELAETKRRAQRAEQRLVQIRQEIEGRLLPAFTPVRNWAPGRP